MAKSFRELKVWNKAVDLALLVYEFTAEFRGARCTAFLPDATGGGFNSK